jgi:aminotransferase class V
VGFPNWENKKDTLLFELDLKGVACSKGSACQSGSVGESHVLQAFLPAERLRYPSLRFSFSIQNTTEEVDNLIKILGEIAKK